ncbi:unnamed protein product, partial [Polarella glacialis]
AYTECEYTNFYFEVNRKALHEALDMFAQLFHEPLFTQDSSSRELKAIESEFQKRRRSDSVRAETLFASLASDGHPWRLFGWGNLQSLYEEPKSKGVDLNSELRSFFQENYKASRMRLCVFGIESLDSLQAAVAESFSVVAPSPGIQPLDFAARGLPMDPAQLPRLVRVRPIKDIHSLYMSWQLPSQLSQYRSKPDAYLGNLIGDEGHGSVLSFLKNAGLATELCAGAGSDNFSHSSNSMIFTVEISLTEKGMQEWAKVAGIVFQYFKMLRGFGDSLPRWPFDEKKLVAQMSYRFLQEKDPCDLVQNLSTRMLPLFGYEAEHLIDGPFRYDDFQEDLIRPLLHGLSVRGCFMMLLSSSYGQSAGLATDGSESGSDGEEEENEEGAEDDAEAGDTSERDEELAVEAKRQRLVQTPAGQSKASPTESQQHANAPHHHPPVEQLQKAKPAETTLDATLLSQKPKLLDPFFDAAAAADALRVEPRFGTEFWDSRLDESLLKMWEEALPDPLLHAPEPNVFIATDFSLLPADADAGGPQPAAFRRSSVFEGFPVPRERLVPAPRLLGSPAGASSLKLWHLNCAEKFGQPRSEVWLKMTSPYYSLDAKNTRKEVLLELYVWCLEDSLNETLYPASKAKLH